MHLPERNCSMNNKRNRRKDNFIVQGSILAVAGLIVRVIGLLYRIPMTNIIGDEGMGYYSFAYEPYSVMLLLSYHGLPTAVSKLAAERNGEGRFKNAYRVFRAAMLLAVLIGAVTGAMMYFGAEYIAGGLNNQPMSAYALRVLGPTIFILAIMGILRGYFQGMGTMVPTALSQIFEAAANAIVSVTAAAYLFDAGAKFDLVVNSSSHAEAYGAAGGTMGTLAGAAVGLVFLFFIYLAFKPMLGRQMRKDRSARKESYGRLVRLLLMTSAPIILSSVIFNVSTTADGALFSSLMQGKFHMSEDAVASLWGIFTNKYKIMIMVPVAIATALATSIVPDFSEDMAAGNKGRLVNKIHHAIRFTMLIAIPSAVGLSVLAGPVLNLLFDNVGAVDINLLRFGTLAVIFYSLSTITNAVLQGIDQMRSPVIHAAAALGAHLLVLAFLVGICGLGIYGVLISYILFALIICVLNARAIRSALAYKQEYVRTFLFPALASALMGGAVLGSYYGILTLSKSNLLSILLSILIGVILYFILLLVFGCLKEEDFYSIPMGDAMLKILRVVHLM